MGWQEVDDAAFARAVEILEGKPPQDAARIMRALDRMANAYLRISGDPWVVEEILAEARAE